ASPKRSSSTSPTSSVTSVGYRSGIPMMIASIQDRTTITPPTMYLTICSRPPRCSGPRGARGPGAAVYQRRGLLGRLLSTRRAAHAGPVGRRKVGMRQLLVLVSLAAIAGCDGDGTGGAVPL